MKGINDKLLNGIVSRILSLATPEKIDNLIIQESDLPGHRRAVPIRLALRGLFPSRDIVVYTPEEVKEWSSVPNAFITTILRERKVLYAKKRE